MLSYLHVKNIALIAELDIAFKEGLNIITGETGAGKSILIGSINAVLGNNISKDFIKQGETDAYIELLFEAYNPMINVILEGLDIETDEQLIISRKIGERSVFRINGQIVNSKVVKLVAAGMIDIHSQHEHQSLLDEKQHILLLDRFLSSEIAEPLNLYKSLYQDIQKIDRELSADQKNGEELEREIEFLEFEINEIESLNIDIDSDQDLEANYKRFQSASETIKQLNTVHDYLNGVDYQYGALHMIESAIKEMASIKSDHMILTYEDRLESISIQINELSTDLAVYADDLNIDLEELDIMQERLDQLNRIRMKYGPTLPDVMVKLNDKKEQLHHILNTESYRRELIAKKAIYLKELKAISIALTEIRTKGASIVEKAIEAQLHQLNLKDAQFLVNISEKTTLSLDGIDHISFYITTNKGQPPKPLSDVASGGEVSRVMLAIKSVLAEVDLIDTMIFDEIDSGISGKTAQLVAEKLHLVGTKRQIIAITHLPQIAAMADAHYKIIKSSRKEVATVDVSQLDKTEQIEELARLLSGKEITETVRMNAKELKKFAIHYKKEE